MLSMILNHEKLYVKMFSQTFDYPFGYEAFDVHQRDKYYHNYLEITKDCFTTNDINDYLLKSQPFGFTVIKVNHPLALDPLFKQDAIVDCDGIYGNDITSITIPLSSTIEVTQVDPNNDQTFFDFLYEDSKTYGISYAKGNVKRQKEVLSQFENQYVYFKAVLDDQVIGTLNVFTHEKMAKLDDFSIREDMQRKGFGSYLMHEVIKHLKSKGITYVYLVTDYNGTAKQMYQTWGFKFISTFEVIRKMSQENTSIN